MIDLLAPRLLWGHVSHRADRRAGLRDALRPRELGQAEVEDLDGAALGDEQVGRLDVPMHDACPMRLGEALPDLRGDVDGVVQWQRPPRNPLLERLPFVVGHHEVQLPVGRLVDLVDGADVRVV